MNLPEVILVVFIFIIILCAIFIAYTNCGQYCRDPNKPFVSSSYEEIGRKSWFRSMVGIFEHCSGEPELDYAHAPSVTSSGNKLLVDDAGFPIRNPKTPNLVEVRAPPSAPPERPFPMPASSYTENTSLRLDKNKSYGAIAKSDRPSVACPSRSSDDCVDFSDNSLPRAVTVHAAGGDYLPIPEPLTSTDGYESFSEFPTSIEATGFAASSQYSPYFRDPWTSTKDNHGLGYEYTAVPGPSTSNDEFLAFLGNTSTSHDGRVHKSSSVVSFNENSLFMESSPATNDDSQKDWSASTSSRWRNGPTTSRKSGAGMDAGVKGFSRKSGRSTNFPSRHEHVFIPPIPEGNIQDLIKDGKGFSSTKVKTEP